MLYLPIAVEHDHSDTLLSCRQWGDIQVNPTVIGSGAKPGGNDLLNQTHHPLTVVPDPVDANIGVSHPRQVKVDNQWWIVGSHCDTFDRVIPSHPCEWKRLSTSWCLCLDVSKPRL